MKDQSRRNEAVIQLEGLTKTFGEYNAVHNVSLEVKRRQIFGFVGLGYD